MANAREYGLVALGAKAGQQLSLDLEGVVGSEYSGFSQNMCRLGFVGASAVVIDKGFEYVEDKINFPRHLRGLMPLVGATLGVGLAISYANVNYDSNLLNSPEVIETTKAVIGLYYENLTGVFTRSDIHSGYLMGAGLTLKSGARLLKNLVIN
jgi:hypothetical protein